MAHKKNSDRIVSAKERRDLVPYSDMHVWRLEKTGEFPQRIRLGANRVGWSLNELDTYIEEKKRARGSK
jgi:prophage regulatory protein